MPRHVSAGLSRGPPSPFWASVQACLPAGAVPSHWRWPRVLRTSMATSPVSSQVNSSGTPSARPRPVAIIVSIPKQLIFVYRNGILIGASTCSTGKPGQSTPTGVLTILDEAKVHTSATYGEPMTWRSSPARASRSMSAICRAIPTPTAAFTCRQTSPPTSTPSPRSGRR